MACFVHLGKVQCHSVMKNDENDDVESLDAKGKGAGQLVIYPEIIEIQILRIVESNVMHVSEESKHVMAVNCD